MQLKINKYLLYIVLVIVVGTSFLLANLVLNLLISNLVSFSALLVLIINLSINFILVYLIFQMIQNINEKEKLIQQLDEEIIKLKIPQEEKKEDTVTTVNVTELAQQLIPSTPQNLSLKEFCEKTLINIANKSQLATGIFYVKNLQNNTFDPVAKYAYYSPDPIEPVVEGEGIVGQAIKDKKPIAITNIPNNYLRVVSGLGQSNPRYLYILPILNKEEVVAALELASFSSFDDQQWQMLEQLTGFLGKIILKIK